jgi:hypothetical protein
MHLQQPGHQTVRPQQLPQAFHQQVMVPGGGLRPAVGVVHHQHCVSGQLRDLLFVPHHHIAALNESHTGPTGALTLLTTAC